MHEQVLEQARVLVVDDDAQNVRYIQDVLEWAGYRQVKGTTQPTQVLGQLYQFRPDLILLDLIMPDMDGYEVMEVLQGEGASDGYVPILVLTSDTSQEAKRRALSLGAKDFLTKPFSPTEIRHRVANLLETRFLYLKCRDQAALLEARESMNGTGTSGATEELLDRLVRVATYGSDPSGDRSRAAGVLTGRIARALGQPEPVARLIERASQLHDLGMVAWRGSASGVVRAEAGEAEIAFPEHTEIGADLLADSDLPVLRMAADISLSHHERWDGTGFPRGLRGQETPLPGRIVAVALAYEARVRETGSSPRAEAEQQALGSIQEESGRAFDPAVVDALAATLATGAGTPSSP